MFQIYNASKPYIFAVWLYVGTSHLDSLQHYGLRSASSSIPWDSQARTLEWVVLTSFRIFQQGSASLHGQRGLLPLVPPGNLGFRVVSSLAIYELRTWGSIHLWDFQAKYWKCIILAHRILPRNQNLCHILSAIASVILFYRCCTRSPV